MIERIEKKTRNDRLEQYIEKLFNGNKMENMRPSNAGGCGHIYQKNKLDMRYTTT